MKVTRVVVARRDVPLSRPYAVAGHATDSAPMVLLRVDTDAGLAGLGAATPEPEVNGDTRDAAFADLLEVDEWLRGREVAPPLVSAPELRGLRSPGARAAIDMALHDLHARAAGRPLVDVLGRAHDALPTSVTIGIVDVATTLAEAREHVARGFGVVKVKIGEDLDLDVERLARLRETAGPGVAIRVDANQGYGPRELLQFLAATGPLDLQFVEQPLPRAAVAPQLLLPEALRRRLMADESVHDSADAQRLAALPQPFGSFNIKLMKCGGIAPAREIGAVAEVAGLGLMWGCMDESRIAIAAALHAALSCPATRWLDLDGHLDLSRDFATGGFRLERGVLSVLDAPGLGVEATDDW